MAVDQATIVTRFAPSPTGYLHVGGARTALFSWLLARHVGGRFLLRIEDTDLARSTPQATEQLLEDLRWLGLHWDNAELVYQSRRSEVYNAIIEDMIARGLAYKAFETREELAELRQIAQREKRQFIYRRREISAAELARFESERRPHVVRFAMPVREYRFRDEVLGKEVVLPADEVQDFVIRKEDGMPTYHFAVVVDDAEMQVTHVLRGKEHLKNTFLHIALQEALGFPRPVYAHLPIIMNLDGSKMSKRDRDKKIRESAKVWMKQSGKTAADLASASSLESLRLEAWLKDSKSQLDLDEQQRISGAIHLDEADLPEILVHDFRRNGYFAGALLNFLALLGWNPGQDREQMSLEEMVQLFSVERIGSNDPKFDRTKLLAFNTKHAETAPAQTMVKSFRDYLEVHPDSPLNAATDAQIARLLEMKAGFRLLREVDQASRFLFIPDAAVEYDPSAVEKVLKKNDAEGARVLGELKEVLAGQQDWSAGALEASVHHYGEQKQLGLGKLAQPLRVAISGTTISPPIFQSLEFLGRERTLARIDRCLQTIGRPT